MSRPTSSKSTSSLLHRMLIVLQDDEAKEPVVISAGSYRHKRARALTDFARASVQISDLIEAGV